MLSLIRRWYRNKLWTKQQVRGAVACMWITEAQADEIIGGE